MSDDYCAIAVGQELGAWEGMGYWYSNWAGSYANFFFKSVIAPLDTLAPAITPLLIVGLWWLATTFVFAQLLRVLPIASERWKLAILLSSAVVATSLNAMYSPQSFYWFAASTHYTLPLALLTGFCGLPLWISSRHKRSSFIASAGLSGALCFVSGGASEIFVVFQLGFMTLCGLPMLLLWRIKALRRSFIVFAVGWLATLAAFLVQISSPGLANRAAFDAAQFGFAMREPAVLAARTLELTFEFLGHPPAFAGFIVLFAAGMLATLRIDEATSLRSESTVVVRPLVFGFIFQLIWIPLLWSHISDEPLFFGRFSGGFLVVVVINALHLICFLVLMTWRVRINNRLRDNGISHSAIVTIVLGTVLVLFALTQLRSIHFRAAAYLFTSAVSWLVLLAQQLLAEERDITQRRLNWLSLYSPMVAVACLAAVVFAALFGRGFVDERILAPTAWLLVMPGLLVGAQLGSTLGLTSPSGVRVIKTGCVIVILVVSIGITFGHLTLLPDFQKYARTWDARHQLILEQRNRGQREIVVSPLAFDLADYVGVVALGQDPANRCALRYYGADSIVVTAN